MEASEDRVGDWMATYKQRRTKDDPKKIIVSAMKEEAGVPRRRRGALGPHVSAVRERATGAGRPVPGDGLRREIECVSHSVIM
jgi:hypothetical protein